jgi:MFS family permease
MFLYSAASVVVGTVSHISAMDVSRLCCGILSTIPTIIIAGSVEDMYSQETRVWMIFAWGVASNIGLTLGPIYSTYITENIGW